MPLMLGNLALQMIPAGLFKMDGGAMFGVVPKPLWSKRTPADELNRIPLATNCLLIRSGDAAVLVDTGYGPNLSDREQKNFSISSNGHPLLRALSQAGVDAADITHVVLSHLHFDHAGGCTTPGDEGRLKPTFPTARHIVQRAEWEDAAGNIPELRGAYFERDFLPLHEAGLVDLVEGDAEVMPGISVRLAPGHTRGHQLVLIESQSQSLLFVSDLCPTTAHLRTFWTMGYDQNLLQVRRIKPEWLGRAADEGWTVYFYHDPKMPAIRLRRDPKEEFAIEGVVAMRD